MVRHTASARGRDVYGIIIVVFPKATYPASQVQWFEEEISVFLSSIQKNEWLQVISTTSE